jgi:hypothetical protein
MKNVWNKYKWIFLFLINALPFVLDVLFYTTGKMDNLFLFLPIFAGLTALNYRNCQKVVPFILYQAFMLICIICAGYASTYLYYHNVSNDFMTPVLGKFITLLCAGISIVATLITAVVKAVKNKKHAV